MQPAPTSFMQKAIAFIGASSGWGAQHRETEQGPQSLYASGLLEELISAHILAIWSEHVRPIRLATEVNLNCGKPTLPLVVSHAQKLIEAVRRVLQQDQFPVVIGGDHSIAIGTWTGVVQALGLEENFGLLWIDAHMDAHTPLTSPSQAYHGMPVAALLGYGEEQLVHIGGISPKLRPQHIILMATRSYESGEAELLSRLGVKIYFMEEVQRRGFAVVFKEAITILKERVPAFGMSIDMDAFDPKEAPGVGTPAPDGLKAEEVLDVLHDVRTLPQFKALEITEYNPVRDQGGKTAQLIINILKEILPR
jgi:arginase